MSKFSNAVLRVVGDIPLGKVMSYGMVALYVGVPRGARQVGWILRQNHDHSVPWWRVINKAGKISIRANFEHDANEQRDLLRAENVEVGDNYSLDMPRYEFLPDRGTLKTWGLEDEYLETIVRRFKTRY